MNRALAEQKKSTIMRETMSEKILIADDEADVRGLVRSNLKAAGFGVLEADDGREVLEKAQRELPALIVLDLMLPELSGLDVCKALKADSLTAKIPIIMLTAKAEEIDRIVGLELGADDYITKPFSPRELVLRIKSVLRRGDSEEENLLTAGEIHVDLQRHLVLVKKKAIDLTATEFKLLTTLIERRGRVQNRDTLLNDVWGYESVIDTRTVDTHIRRLREKLGRAGDCIETIRGFGYRIEV